MKTNIINFQEEALKLQNKEHRYLRLKQIIEHYSKEYSKLLDTSRNWFCNGGDFQVFKQRTSEIETILNSLKQVLNTDFQNEIRIEREKILKKAI